MALAIPLVANADYPPGPYPGPGPAGAYATVVASQTICSTAGTLTATYGSATLTLVVPAGAFSQCTQVTIYADNPAVISPLLPSGSSLVDAYAVGWTPTSTASVALTLTISDPAIPGSATVYQTTASGLTPFSGAQVKAGSVSVSFTSDPGFVIAKTTAGTPTPVTLTDGIAPGVNRAMSGFGTKSLVVAPNSYVTILVQTSPNLAGSLVQIWVETKTSGWHDVTLRQVASDGTVHYFARVNGWTAYWVKFPGDATHAAAASHGRIATSR
jgi:hypothetical protein